MFKIKDNIIKITRGDSAIIELTIEGYRFQVGDVIVFAVYNKRGLDEKPLLTKTININEDSESVNIELSSQDTKIGDFINKPKEYWYEIELNDEVTVIGYDEDGAKIFELYPEGVDENDN